MINFFYFLVLMSLCNLCYADDFGKVRGIVTSEEDGLPLVGVNISILNTNLGTITDGNGNYTILKVPSGNYSIKYDYIGRATKIIEDINIGASLSTNLDASLKESVIEGEEVIVSGKRKIIQDDITSSTIYMLSLIHISEPTRH